ncbi:hypothetical protein AHF37_06118 [Paragonimus kellicotti]|nr:hypothetical protein AHF37_06118 [Paragonimus kellicotti]
MMKPSSSTKMSPDAVQLIGQRNTLWKPVSIQKTWHLLKGWQACIPNEGTTLELLRS